MSAARSRTVYYHDEAALCTVLANIASLDDDDDVAQTWRIADAE